MKSNKGFTLIELLAIIVILAVIALITTPIILNIINQSKEAANLRSVEAYAKAVEYAVMEYEYENNGELPADFDAISSKVSYSNSDVVCNVAINCDKKGEVILTGCKVGSYTNNYYKYDSKAGNKGAEKDTSASAPSGTTSVKASCPSA